MIGRSPVGSTPITSNSSTLSTDTVIPAQPGAPVNERDSLLRTQARRTGIASSAVVLNPSSSNFFVQADGSHAPDFIRVTFASVLADGPYTFSAQNATLSNVTMTSADVYFSDMPLMTAVITVTATNNGNPVSGSCIIGKLTAGSVGDPGPDGPRGAGHFYASGTAWNDNLADTTVLMPKQVGDVVTISSSTYALTKIWNGTAWAAMGAIYDGSLFVTGSIAAASIDTRGLTVKDASGNILLGSGTALDWSNVGGVNRPADNATVGGTLGQNIDGQITAATASTYIAAAAIGSAQIEYVNASQVNAGNLSAITAIIGTLRTTSTGSRMEIKDNVITSYVSNVPRCKFGDSTL